MALRTICGHLATLLFVGGFAVGTIRYLLGPLNTMVPFDGVVDLSIGLGAMGFAGVGISFEGVKGRSELSALWRAWYVLIGSFFLFYAWRRLT